VAESTATAVRFFDDLSRSGVRYCQFKSNAHLVAGLEGVTDLDLLFDGRQVELVEEILARHGFKRFPAHPSRRYPGVEDFFGLNEDTGRLLHLQLHYRLVVGERFFKNYRLPWEEEFLEARVLDERTGVFVADPVFEWLLLVCRAALKIRWRDRLLAGFSSYPSEFRAMLTEHAWLARHADLAAVRDLARGLLGDRAAEAVARSLDEDLKFRRLKLLRGELLPNPNVFRGYRALPALVRRWGREARWCVGTLNRRYFHRAFPYSRSGSSGGTVIAVVGSDGAGKSSVTKGLHSWLSGKVDVLPIYFGSGDGRSSLLRWPLKLVLVLIRRRSGPPRLDPLERQQREITLARAIWALTLAREKRSKLRLVMRARERGFVVVCDRYPQTQVGGVSDGPLLGRWKASRSRVKRGLARWEEGIYELAEDVPPDVVVRLFVTPETAMARRPGDDPRELNFRTRLVSDLRFEHARYGVIDIDADADLASVVLEVKRRLWQAI
jgi:thymidylate kinase